MIAFVIGGKERSFVFDISVLGKVQKDLDIDMVELGEALSKNNLFMIVPSLIYRGNERFLQKEGKAIDFTFEDVDTWLQEKGIYDPEILSLWYAFNESLQSYLPKLEETKKTVSKKK